MNQETAQKRIKVLFVVTKSNLGGAQKYVYDLATSLSKDAFEPVVLCGAAQGSTAAGQLIDMLNHASIRTIFIPEMGRDISLSGDVRLLLKLRQIMRTECPDAVHLNSSKAGGLGALAARLGGVKKIIFTSHGLAYDEPRSSLARAAIFTVSWLTFALSHIVICISKDNADRVRRLPFCSKKVRLIHNGIRQPDMLERADARRKLNELAAPIAQDVTWIGTISELVPNKGLSYAIRACQELKRSGSRFVFLIIGSGDLQVPLQRLIDRYGLADNVRLLGYVPHAARLLKAFDIFTLTSRKEGLPYVLLEAGYANLPVVATDIPGIRDIIDNGVSGALCSHRDPELAADSLQELIHDPSLRSTFGSALHDTVASRFSFERMVRETTELYR